MIHGHAVAIKRFDRAGGRRLHSLSARVALQAAAEGFGYPELAQLLRRKEVRAVAGVVDGWKEHFSQCNVTAGDIDLYAEHIDRPFLKEQRDEVGR